VWQKQKTMGVDFHERMNEIHTELKRLNDEANVLMNDILKNWEDLNHE
jgi:type I restriction enzyme M protein